MPVKTDAGTEHYVSDVMQSRRMVAELINEATMRFQDEHQEWRWRDDPLRELHKGLQTAIMTCRSEVLPYSDDIPGVWEAEIVTLADGETVTLASLESIEFGPMEFHELVNAIGQPARRESKTYYRYLSLATAKAVRDQLNRCVRELGLMPTFKPNFDDGYLGEPTPEEEVVD